MKNFYILATALDYIENNIYDDFSLEDVVKVCSSSLSNLHKLFSYAFGYSIKDYVQRRRHSLACNDLITTKMSILEIAIKYQYNSHEVFIRAFKKLRGESPSAYRKNNYLPNLYPKLNLNLEGGLDMRKVDISELYELLKSLGGSYLLCADIVHFKSVNDNFGYTVGDIILSKTAKRIEKYISDKMLLFRIGRDEFAVITGLYEKDKIDELSNNILSENGMIELAEDNEIPLSLRIGLTKLPNESLCYEEVLQSMQNAINESRITNG